MRTRAERRRDGDSPPPGHTGLGVRFIANRINNSGKRSVVGVLSAKTGPLLIHTFKGYGGADPTIARFSYDIDIDFPFVDHEGELARTVAAALEGQAEITDQIFRETFERAYTALGQTARTVRVPILVSRPGPTFGISTSSTGGAKGPGALTKDVMDRLPDIRLQNTSALLDEPQLTIPPGYEPRLLQGAAESAHPAVVVLVHLAKRAIEGKSREENLAWVRKALKPSSFVLPGYTVTKDPPGIAGRSIRLTAHSIVLLEACPDDCTVNHKAYLDSLREVEMPVEWDLYLARLKEEYEDTVTRPHRQLRERVEGKVLAGCNCVACVFARWAKAEDASTYMINYKDREKAKRLKVAPPSPIQRGDARAMTAFPALPGKAAQLHANHSEAMKSYIFNGTLLGEAVLGSLAPLFQASTATLDSAKARLAALKDAAIACGPSIDQAAYFDFTATPPTPLLHADAPLDLVPYWMNWAKKSRSPLTVPTLVLAAFGKAQGHHLELEDWCDRLAQLDKTWSTGKGTSRQIRAAQLVKAYAYGSETDSDKVARAVREVETDTRLAPRAFKKLFNANAVKGQEVLGPAALRLWAEAAELKAQRDASRTIELLCSSLEERGELSTAGRLSPEAAFPGLLWPGDEDVEEDDIVEFALTFWLKMAVDCDESEKRTGGVPAKEPCDVCVPILAVVWLALEISRSGGRDQLTGLRYGPFGSHHPLKASLGHTNHLELSRLRDLHLDALHDDNPAPDRVDALIDAVQGLLAGVKATIQAWGSNSLIRWWLPTTLSVALSSCADKVRSISEEFALPTRGIDFGRTITLADLSAFALNGGEIGGGLGPPDHRGSVEGNTGGPVASSSRVTLDSGGGGDGTGSAVATSSRVTLDSGGGGGTGSAVATSSHVTLDSGFDGGASSAFGIGSGTGNAIAGSSGAGSTVGTSSGGTGNAIAGSSGVGGAVASTSRVALDSGEGTDRSVAGSSRVALARNLKHR